MSPDDPTLPDRIHLRTLVEHGLAPLLKMDPMEILRQMLGGDLPQEPVFANLTARQLEQCIEAAGRVMVERRAAEPAPEPVLKQSEQRLAYNSEETARLLGIHRATLWRLCKRGLLRPSVAMRIPLFPVSEIERFLRETTSETCQSDGHPRGRRKRT
jgi:hypothetical protein